MLQKPSSPNGEAGFDFNQGHHAVLSVSFVAPRSLDDFQSIPPSFVSQIDRLSEIDAGSAYVRYPCDNGLNLFHV